MSCSEFGKTGGVAGVYSESDLTVGGSDTDVRSRSYSTTITLRTLRFEPNVNKWLEEAFNGETGDLIKEDLVKAHDLYQDVIYHEAQEGGVEYESLPRTG